MANRKVPCPTMLRLVLNYDAETGLLRWKDRPKFLSDKGSRSGKLAMNCPTVYGYLQGGVLGYVGVTHRVIWALVYGYWPRQIDHINGNRQDNRIVNLREVNDAENHKNHRMRHDNKTGFNGVQRYGDRWRAEIGVNWKRLHLGLFDNFADAVAARKAANLKYGFHENHGQVMTTE